MTTSKTPALRPYLEAITEHCDRLTKEQLVKMIICMAQDVPQVERADFLKKIPGLSQRTVFSKMNSRDMLAKIQDLKMEICARVQSIDDGSHYDEDDDWSEYDDEGAPYLIEEMNAEIECYFRESDKIFWAGNFEEAKNLVTTQRNKIRLFSRLSGSIYVMNRLKALS